MHLIEIEKIPEFIDHDKKVLLFKGASFNITGHYKNNNELPGHIIEGSDVKDLMDKIQSGTFTNVKNETLTEAEKEELKLDESKIVGESKINITTTNSTLIENGDLKKEENK